MECRNLVGTALFLLYFEIVFFFNTESVIYNSYDSEELIKKLYDPFRENKPVGLPVFNLPNTFHNQPPIRTPALTLYNFFMTSGKSDLMVKLFDVNFLTQMIVVDIKLPKMQINGYYNMPGLWTCSTGELDLLLEDVVTNFNLRVDFNSSYVSLELSNLKFTFKESDIKFNMTGAVLEHQTLIDSGEIRSIFIPLCEEIFTTYASLFSYVVSTDVNGYFDNFPNLPLDYSRHSFKTAAFMYYVLDELDLQSIELPDFYDTIGVLSMKYMNGRICGIPNIDKIYEVTSTFHDGYFYVYTKARIKHLLFIVTYEAKFTIFFHERLIKADIKNLIVELKIRIDPKNIHPVEIEKLELTADSLIIQNKGGIIGPIKSLIIDAVNDSRQKHLNNAKYWLLKTVKKKLYDVNMEEVFLDVVEFSKANKKLKKNPYRKSCN